MRFDAPHLDAEPPQYVQTVHGHHPWVECDSQAHEEILRAIHPSKFIGQAHDHHISSGSKLKAFLEQVRPQASHPMQLSGFFTLANILADSSSSTSLGASTWWAQIFMQRPQPMHLLSSTALTKRGVHSCRPRVIPVM
jgi:hypothetical protein